MEYIQKVMDYIPVAAQLLMALTIAATLVVRITPSESDDKDAQEIADKLLRILSWLPTIGVNPRTRRLEEAYKELRDGDD